jgi:hypothetical protein
LPTAISKTDGITRSAFGELLKNGILGDSARVGGRLGEDGEGKVTVFSRDVRVHGLLSFERLGVRGVERTARAVRIVKVAISWLGQFRFLLFGYLS